MECYFYGKIREDGDNKENNAVVSFFIPELGISFRAQFQGNIYECEYASLLSLLEFIELNPHLFKNKHLEIFGDSYIVVNQVNMCLICTNELKPYRDMALGYKKKFPFILSWIPKSENPAQDEFATR
jgi:hypothetical protein